MLVEEALVAYQAHEDRKTAEAAHPSTFLISFIQKSSYLNPLFLTK